MRTLPIEKLLDAVGDARLVLLGEDSHSTKEFDAVIHIDTTTALQPLERWARDEVDLPETYPSGV